MPGDFQSFAMPLAVAHSPWMPAFCRQRCCSRAQVPGCMQGLTGYAVAESIMRCAGSAVVVERGGCTFLEKAQALSAAHAAAMIVYNTEEGQHTICLSPQLTHRPCMRVLLRCECALHQYKASCLPAFFHCTLHAHRLFCYGAQQLATHASPQYHGCQRFEEYWAAANGRCRCWGKGCPVAAKVCFPAPACACDERHLGPSGNLLDSCILVLW